jgi:hypothetical protein
MRCPLDGGGVTSIDEQRDQNDDRDGNAQEEQEQ